MKYLYCKLLALSPLAMRSDHAPGGVMTAHFVSGTTFAGSLAAAHRALARGKDVDAEFENLFLQENVYYPNLYPALFTDKSMSDSVLPVYPVPKTAQTCKRFPGFRHRFKNDRGPEERHGVRDTLFDWAIFALGNSARALHQHRECPECHAAMDYFDGYYRNHRSRQHQMISSLTHKRVQTHTGINRESGTVQEDILYSREVLEEDMQFWGKVKITHDGLVEILQQAIKKIDHEEILRIGTGRSRGTGNVRIEIGEIENEKDSREERFEVFKERLQLFDNELRKRVNIDNLAPFYFAITLHAPLILRDKLLRYRGVIDGETLAELTKIPALKLIHKTGGLQRVMGWNDLWSTPRPHEYAIDTGSVFLFASLEKEGHDNSLLQALFELEENGMGSRKAEGFGHLCISDPFHRETK